VISCEIDLIPQFLSCDANESQAGVEGGERTSEFSGFSFQQAEGEWGLTRWREWGTEEGSRAEAQWRGGSRNTKIVCFGFYSRGFAAFAGKTNVGGDAHPP